MLYPPFFASILSWGNRCGTIWRLLTSLTRCFLRPLIFLIGNICAIKTIFSKPLQRKDNNKSTVQSRFKGQQACGGWIPTSVKLTSRPPLLRHPFFLHASGAMSSYSFALKPIVGFMKKRLSWIQPFLLLWYNHRTKPSARYSAQHTLICRLDMRKVYHHPKQRSTLVFRCW